MFNKLYRFVLALCASSRIFVKVEEEGRRSSVAKIRQHRRKVMSHGNCEVRRLSSLEM